MRYFKAIATMVICVTLAGLLIQKLPEYETAIVIIGFAAGVILSRQQLRKV